MSVKLIIAGSRSYSDYELLAHETDCFLHDLAADDVTIISGGALGADLLGERYANARGYRIEKFLPNWKTDGHAAGIIRNIKMAQACTHCIVFFNGMTRGTTHMRDAARRRGKATRVVTS